MAINPWQFTSPFIPYTQIRAEAVNPNFSGISVTLKAITDDLNKFRLRLPQNFNGSSELAEQMLEDRMIGFDADGQLQLVPKSQFVPSSQRTFSVENVLEQLINPDATIDGKWMVTQFVTQFSGDAQEVLINLHPDLPVGTTFFITMGSATPVRLRGVYGVTVLAVAETVLTQINSTVAAVVASANTWIITGDLAPEDLALQAQLTAIEESIEGMQIRLQAVENFQPQFFISLSTKVFKSAAGPVTLTAHAFALDYAGRSNSYPGRFRWLTSADGAAFAVAQSSNEDQITSAFVVPADTVAARVELYKSGGFDYLLGQDSAIAVTDGVNFDLRIESTNGTVFRPGEARNTLLIARVFRNGVDVTDLIPGTYFQWQRVSMDPKPPPNDDATWNTQFASGYKNIDITVDDVDAKATFHCYLHSF